MWKLPVLATLAVFVICFQQTYGQTPAPPSCEGHCGGKPPGYPCYCDQACQRNGDCCPDVQEFCFNVDCLAHIDIPMGGYVDVTSPNYPENYPNNALCEWIVHTENNTRVLVEHLDFATETGYDFYSAGHGMDSRDRNSTVIEQHSGDLRPGNFLSFGSSVWLHFDSDFVVNERGFRNRLYDTGRHSCEGLCGVSNTFQDCSCSKDCVLDDTCCSDYFPLCAGDCVESIVVPQGGQVTVSSPNYPSNYADDSQCEWIVSASQASYLAVRFNDFSTQLDSDYFFAGNGDDPSQATSVYWAYSGSTLPEDFLSTESSVWMRFVSDSSVTDKGFEVIVEDTYGKGYCTGGCGWYNTEFYCSCHSDCIVTGDCCLDFFEKCGGDCSEHLYINTNEYIDIYSPNYPNNYDDNLRCQWIIHQNETTTGRLSVDFKDFSTQEGSDFLYAGHGDQPSPLTTEISGHSGNSTPTSYTSDELDVWLRFLSDNSTGDRGFHAVVESIGSSCLDLCNRWNPTFSCSCMSDCFYLDECCDDYVEICVPENCTQEITVPAGQKTTITSLNYPNNYPNNAACKWILHSGSGTNLLVHFDDFATETCCDHVSSGNGAVPSDETSVISQHSGSVLPDDYLSSEPSVWLTFTSDFSITDRGFMVSFTDTGTP